MNKRNFSRQLKPSATSRNGYDKRGERETETRAENRKPRNEKKPGSSNDPSWYTANEQLLRDVASFPFSYPLGFPIDLTGNASGIAGREPFSPAGAMVVTLAPSFGWCESGSDPLNLAAAAVYSFVRHANSGSRNYNDADLMIYIIAMDQIFSAINWLQRVYDSTFVFAQRNHYLGDNLLKAQGVNPSIRNELANFRAGINQLINKVTQFAVPNDLPIFRRHAMLYSSIYAEGESVKDQIYFFNPEGFYKFKLQTSGSVGAGSLTFSPTGVVPGTTLKTGAQLLSYVEDLIAAIAQDEDFSIISGDILKAYNGNIIKLAAVPEFTPLAPITDLTMLEQIKNATIVDGSCPIRYYPNHFDLQQDATNGLLKFTPKAEQNTTTPTANDKRIGALLADKKILGTILVAPGPAEVIERSRLTIGVRSFDSGTGVSSLTTGTEIAMNCYMMKLDTPSSFAMYNTLGYVLTSETSLTGSSAKTLAMMSNFRFHPMVRVIINQNSTTQYDVGQFFDADNYTVLDQVNLQNLHMCAIMSELGVNSIAKF